MASWAAGSLLAILAFLTVRQIGYWHDSVTLFEHAISVVDSDYMRANLATALVAQGRYAEAEPHLEAAIRLAPDEYGYHHDLAALLSRAGQLDEAARESAAAVRLAPSNAGALESRSRHSPATGPLPGRTGRFRGGRAARVRCNPCGRSAERCRCVPGFARGAPVGRTARAKGLGTQPVAGPGAPEPDPGA
jgi:tetratricopeptide (TPR) repeat protein